MIYIRFFFVLYWVAPFLKFGPLPSKNLDARLIKLMVSSKKCKEWMNVVNNDNRMEIVDNSTRKISVIFFLIIFRLFPPTLVADLPFINPNLGGGGVG